MSMKRPIVSVAMVTYNQENFIKQAIDSILMQKVDFDYEIVIGEDKSPDNTRKILLEYKEKYPERFKLILRDKNIGPTKNLYDVFKNCSGKYIAILEGDDYWIDNKKLKIQVDFLDSHKDYVACSHRVFMYDCQNMCIDDIINNTNKPVINDISDMNLYVNKYGAIHIQSLVFRNIFYHKSDKYKKILTCVRYTADYQLIFILSSLGKIQILNPIMGIYRHLNSTSYTCKDIEYRCKERVRLTELLKSYFPKNKKFFNKFNIKHKTQAITELIKTNDISRTLSFYRKLNMSDKLCVLVLFAITSFRHILKNLLF